MQPASATEIQPAISLLEKTPRLLETLLGDLPGELLHWKPAQDRWSISEVLAHLAALEQVYGERMLRMIAEDSPALTKYDLAGAAARGEYSRGSAGENLALFTRTGRSTSHFTRVPGAIFATKRKRSSRRFCANSVLSCAK